MRREPGSGQRQCRWCHLFAVGSVGLVALATIPATLSADDVLLANGRQYKGVIAERQADGVHIRLTIGELVLPHRQVARIDRGETPLETFLARRQRLREDPQPSAAAWLELARWATVNELDQGAREAGLMAAALDPTLEGLGALLRPLGLIFDDQMSQWISQDELMARRGYVRDGGEWVTIEEHERRVARGREAVARALDDLAERRWREAEAAARERAEASPPPIGIPVAWVPYGASAWYPNPGYVHPSPLRRPPRRHHAAPSGPHHRPAPASRRSSFDAVATRQPGSVLPLSMSPSAIAGRVQR